MKKLLVIGGLCAAFLLSGCDDNQPKNVIVQQPTPSPIVTQPEPVQQPQVVYEQAPVQQQPQVVVVQQPPVQQPYYDSSHHLVTHMLAGAALHHMFSSRSSSRPTVVHNTTVINKTYSRPSRSYYGSSSRRSFSSFSRRR